MVSMNVELGLMQIGGGNVVVTKGLICSAAFNSLKYDMLVNKDLDDAAAEIHKQTDKALFSTGSNSAFAMIELLYSKEIIDIVDRLVDYTQTNVGVLQRNRNNHYHMIYFRIINELEPVLILTDENHASPYNLNDVKVLTPFTKLTEENIKNVKFSIAQFNMLAKKFKSNMFNLAHNDKFTNVDGFIVAKQNATPTFDSLGFFENMRAAGRTYRRIKRTAYNNVINPLLEKRGFKGLSVSASRTRTRTLEKVPVEIE